MIHGFPFAAPRAWPLSRSSTQRACRLLLVALTLLAACTDTRSRTQVMVEVDADEGVRESLATLRILVDVSDDAGKTWKHKLTETYDDKRVGGWKKFAWPARLGLVPAGDNYARQIAVRAQALDADGELYVWQSAVAGFTKEHTTVLRMTLVAACVAQRSTCGKPTCVGTDDCKTCQDGTCVDVGLVKLGEFDPDARRDAGAGADAGGDAEVGPSDDAAVTDAGTDGGGKEPRSDAGADAGKQDAGSDAGENPTQPLLHVTSSTPDAADSVLTDNDAVVQVKFSAPIDAETITSSSFEVTRAGAAVDGALTIGKSTVSFAPDDPWVLAGAYTLKVSDDVTDAEGNALDPFSLQFTFRDGEWTKREVTGLQDALSGPFLALAGDGEGVVVWSRMGSSTFDVVAQRFSPPSTWTAPDPVASGIGGFGPVTINSKHHVVISTSTISNHYSGKALVAGPGWEDAGYIQNGGSHPSFFLDKNDRLYVAADAFGASNGSELKGLDFTLPAVSPAAFSIGDNAGDDHDASLAMLKGSPRVVWRRRDNSTSPWRIMAGLQNLTTPIAISTPGADVGMPRLASNAEQSAAIAVWEQVEPTWTNIWAARIPAGGAWGAAERISDDTSSTAAPKIAMDNQGHAIAVWNQNGGVAAATYTPGSGWSAPLAISKTAVNAGPPEVAIEPGGNAIAAWAQDGAEMMLNEVWVARFVTGKGWQSKQRVRVSDMEAGTGENVSLAIDDYGRASLSWIEAKQVWVGRFE